MPNRNISSPSMSLATGTSSEKVRSNGLVNQLRGKVLRYEEVDEEGLPTGRSASLLGVELQGLQYSDLINQKLSSKVKVPLRWKNARVVESTIPELSIETLTSGETIVESFYSSKTLGLVKDGWLPSGLALQDNMIVMPDAALSAS